MRIESLQVPIETQPVHGPAEPRVSHALPERGKPLPPERPPEPEAVLRAAEGIERFLRERGHQLSFSVDSTTGRTVVAVRDPATGDLIRQVPSEEALRIARNLDANLPALIREQA